MKNPMIVPNSSTSGLCLLSRAYTVRKPSENAVNPAKRRKFGSDSKNLEVMDAEKEVEELPTIYSTPATSKRSKILYFLNKCIQYYIYQLRPESPNAEFACIFKREFAICQEHQEGNFG
jgi:hypothetical protein